MDVVQLCLAPDTRLVELKMDFTSKGSTNPLSVPKWDAFTFMLFGVRG